VVWCDPVDPVSLYVLQWPHHRRRFMTGHMKHCIGPHRRWHCTSTASVPWAII